MQKDGITMNIMAIGRSEILYDTILKFLKDGENIVSIIICDESSNYKRKSDDFKKLAEEWNIPFFKTENISSEDSINFIKKYSPDIGISVNWKTIIPIEIINIFRYGIINAHMGNLPRYKGNATPNWAIISGENKIVLTLHYMSQDLDGGDILLQNNFPLSEKTYIGDVYKYALINFPLMFYEVINKVKNKSIDPKKQSSRQSLSLRCFPRLPRDGEIDWNKRAIDIERLVRAVADPFDGAYSFLNNKKLIIWKAHHIIPDYKYMGIPGQIAERFKETGEVSVITGDGLLVLEEVEISKGIREKPYNVIKTIRTRLCLDIYEELSSINNRIEEIKKILEKK